MPRWPARPPPPPSPLSPTLSLPAEPTKRGRTSAPIYHVEPRQIVAVEHPMIVQNIDNAFKTFGRNKAFERILDSGNPEECVPLYLRYNDPMCVPILSHNTPTNNVLLKITVPKRTGRRRKRGSHAPFEDDPDAAPKPQPKIPEPYAERTNLFSYSRLDDAAQIRRALQDNPETTKVEGVGEIRQTHRYRGISDFHHSTSKTEFFPRFQESILPAKLTTIKNFKLDPTTGWQRNEQILPPPLMTNHTLPFNWAWKQNPNVGETLDPETKSRILVNRSKPKRIHLLYLSHEVRTIPSAPPSSLPTPHHPDLIQLIEELKFALEERPIWTRRALANRVGNSDVLYMIKRALQYVGYQFKGGPWRDAIIKYGIDPRSSPLYRQYQTFFFKLYEEEEKSANNQWHDIRTTFNHTKRSGKKQDVHTHIFDGKSVTLDGKVWQACDITDPLLCRLIDQAPYPDHCERAADGWFCNGTAAKIKAIMKVKLVAIRIGCLPPDADFAVSLAEPDIIKGKTSRDIQVPVPDIRLSEEELNKLKERGVIPSDRMSGIRKLEQGVRIRSERIRPFVNGDKPKVVEGMRKRKKTEEDRDKDRREGGGLGAGDRRRVRSKMAMVEEGSTGGRGNNYTSRSSTPTTSQPALAPRPQAVSRQPSLAPRPPAYSRQQSLAPRPLAPRPVGIEHLPTLAPRPPLQNIAPRPPGMERHQSIAPRPPGVPMDYRQNTPGLARSQTPSLNQNQPRPRAQSSRAQTPSISQRRKSSTPSSRPQTPSISHLQVDTKLDGGILKSIEREMGDDEETEESVGFSDVYADEESGDDIEAEDDPEDDPFAFEEVEDLGEDGEDEDDGFEGDA